MLHTVTDAEKCSLKAVTCLPTGYFKITKVVDSDANALQAILNTLKDERGECSLEHLRSSTDEEIKTELERFKGVGKKTIACVLMFCLNRHEFPVDTHVWRITKSLGWVPAKATRDEAYAHLNVRIPDELK